MTGDALDSAVLGAEPGDGDVPASSASPEVETWGVREAGGRGRVFAAASGVPVISAGRAAD
jgi:hypothetical protein